VHRQLPSVKEEKREFDRAKRELQSMLKKVKKELEDDEIESVRRFNVTQQLSQTQLQQYRNGAPTQKQAPQARRNRTSAGGSPLRTKLLPSKQGHDMFRSIDADRKPSQLIPSGHKSSKGRDKFKTLRTPIRNDNGDPYQLERTSSQNKELQVLRREFESTSVERDNFRRSLERKEYEC